MAEEGEKVEGTQMNGHVLKTILLKYFVFSSLKVYVLLE